MAMVKLDQVQKHFNKGKNTEIHVINNTTLEFENTGLIGLLGPSGCGKTTLLNTIGGLDNIDSGSIEVAGKRISKQSSAKIDEIRNINVGYIFQNYNLIDDMSVFENVAIVLRMIGVKDPQEIEEKVNCALEMVGMYRYRSRHADMLSGGERQRVGIARAIVKDPAIIIADEPTGNLDSKNTLEVMNIIKAISRNRLVILVTHEEKLVDFYASRIIRLKDGCVVSDQLNEKADTLDYRVDNNIYLKDFENHEVLNKGNFSIDIFSNGEEGAKLTIVVQNGNVYLKNANTNDRMEIIEEDSSVELIDDHYHGMTAEEFEKHSFDLSKFAHRSEAKYSSIISFKGMMKSGFAKLGSYKPIKKILLLGFLIASMFIMYGVSNMAGVLNFNDDKFVKTNKEYVSIQMQDKSVDKYLKYEKSPEVAYMLPTDSKISMSVICDDYHQTYGFEDTFTGSLTDIDTITADDLKYGKMPKNEKQIVVDKLALTNMMDNGYAMMMGINEVDDYLNRVVTVSGLGNFRIVGITDKHQPCIYTEQSMFYDLLANSASTADEASYDGEVEYSNFASYNRYSITSGSKPSGDYEVAVSSDYSAFYPIGTMLDTKVNGHKLKVVGYYGNESNKELFLVSKTTLKYYLITQHDKYVAYPANSKEETMAVLQADEATVTDTYKDEKSSYVMQKMDSIRAASIVAIIILIISLVEIFLIMRASFLARVKEVGVLRAIGVKKTDIYKMFMGEILAISICASTPGWALMLYLLAEKITKISFIADNYLINPGLAILALAIVFALNLIFGLLPAIRTMAKKPAEILSRNDVN